MGLLNLIKSIFTRPPETLPEGGVDVKSVVTRKNPLNVMVVSDTAPLHRGPGADYYAPQSVIQKERLTIIEVSNGYGRLSDCSGWVSLDDVTEVEA